MVMTGTGCYVIWQPDYHQCIDLVYLVFDGRPLWINVKAVNLKTQEWSLGPPYVLYKSSIGPL